MYEVTQIVSEYAWIDGDCKKAEVKQKFNMCWEDFITFIGCMVDNSDKTIRFEVKEIKEIKEEA